MGDRLFGEAGAAHGAYGRISRKLRQVVGEHSGGGGRHVRDTLSKIRRQAFRLREQPPEDWDFEIEIRPQLFGLMEAEFWEPKAVEPFAAISKSKNEDPEWMNEILQSVGAPLDLRKFRDRVEEVLGERETTKLFRNGGDVPFGARDCGAWSVTASLQARTVVMTSSGTRSFTLT